MDLDGNGNHGLEDLWGQDEEKFDIPVVSSPPPMRSTGFLLLLTLQCVFALVFSNGSAYLSDLGLSRPVLALVWTAGPVAGMVLQPYFGIWSDQLGRRQPFILLGTLAIITSLVGLAFAPAALSHAGLSLAAQSMAMLFMVTLNMAIQPLQGGLRAQLSDACSRAQQPAATALAGIVVSASNVASYLMALMDLPQVFSLGGSSQFSILCVMTSVVLALTVTLTCLGVREGRDYTVQSNPGRYTRDESISDVDLPMRSTRIGSLGLLLFAAVGLISGIALPLAHHHAKGDVRNMESMSSFASIIKQWTGSIHRLWLASHLLYAACMFAVFFATSLACVCTLVGLCGISWAVTIWAPWAIISIHVSYDIDDSEASLSLMQDYGEPEKESSEGSVKSNLVPRQREKIDDCERRPGVVFGLHNASIAGPQILAAAGCSFIFWVVEGTGHDGVAWAMGFGGMAALGAAILAAGIEENHEDGT
ncbi:hypothetical protein E8E14_010289 [Neopestalotiopsis sp. 37M]|nr:hypothetical protein E8E14_010289 [Neopestalotiopsis sp. 37M]